MVPGGFIFQEYKNQIKREAVLSGHTVSLPGYLHGPLQMFGRENGVCNYQALEKINGMLILRIRAFSLFRHLNYKVCMLFT